MFLTFLLQRIPLNYGNFNETIDKRDTPLVVMYYAPWCKHCKAQHPFFIQASDKFKDNSLISTSTIDCVAQSDICKMAEIKGYPTFISYFGEKKNIKLGAKGLDDIEDYLLTELEKAYGINVSRQNEKPNVFPAFLFRGMSGEKKLLNIARRIALNPEFKDIKIYYQEMETANKKGEIFVQQSSSYKKKYEKELTEENITEFVIENQYNILDYWTFEDIEKSTKLFSIFIPGVSLDSLMLRKCAKRYSNISTWVTTKAMGTKRITSLFGLSKKELPAIAVFNPETKKFYFGKKLATIQNIENFYSEFEKGNVEGKIIPLKDKFFASSQQSVLFMELMSAGIGMAIAGIVFYAYNRMLGNIKKHD